MGCEEDAAADYGRALELEPALERDARELKEPNPAQLARPAATKSSVRGAATYTCGRQSGWAASRPAHAGFG